MDVIICNKSPARVVLKSIHPIRKNPEISRQWTSSSLAPLMRARVVHWIFDICDEYDNLSSVNGNNMDVACFAVHLLDKYIAASKCIESNSYPCHILGDSLQFFAAVCICIGFKVVAEAIFDPEEMATNLYARYAPSEFHRMERIILKALNYNVYHTTDYEILHLLQKYLNIEEPLDDLCRFVNTHCADLADYPPIFKAACTVSLHLMRTKAFHMYDWLVDITTVDRTELSRMTATCIKLYHMRDTLNKRL